MKRSDSRRLPLRILVPSMLLAGFPAAMPAGAVSYDNQPKILLHVKSTTTKSQCAYGNLADCRDAVTSGSLYTSPGSLYYVYLLATPGDLGSVGGMQLGITYDQGLIDPLPRGVSIFGWTLCATIEFISNPPRQWPQPGSGNVIVWNTTSQCQSGETAVAGYFYVGAYTADTLQVTPRPVDGAAKAVNCCNDDLTIGTAALGSAIFSSGGTVEGCNPCDGPCPGTPTAAYTPWPCVAPPPPPPPPPPDTLEAAVMLHITAPVAKNACANGFLAIPDDALTQGGLSTASGPFHFAYILVAKRRETNIAGLQCGITYENHQPADMSNGTGIDVFSWTLCATLEFVTPGAEMWPRPGGGNLMTWDQSHCQRNATAVAGYFYMGAYSADFLRLTTRPVDGAAKVANCDGSEIPVAADALGFAAFSSGSSAPGCNPWLERCAGTPIPVETTTWGAVKALFGR